MLHVYVVVQHSDLTACANNGRVQFLTSECFFRLLIMSVLICTLRSEVLLQSAFRSIFGFLNEFIDDELWKKTQFLLQGGASCLVAGNQLLAGAALVSSPDTWVARLAPGQVVASRPTWSGEKGWSGKPTNMGRCAIFHAQLVFDKYETERAKRGAVRNAGSPERKRVKSVLSFDSTPAARPENKKLRQVTEQLKNFVEELATAVTLLDTLSGKKQKTQLARTEDLLAHALKVFEELAQLDDVEASKYHKELKDLKKAVKKFQE